MPSAKTSTRATLARLGRCAAPLVVIAAALPGLAFAQSATGTTRGANAATSFDSLDKDANGSLDAAELAGASGSVSLSQLDRNGDGRINRGEYQSGVAAPGATQRATPDKGTPGTGTGSTSGSSTSGTGSSSSGSSSGSSGGTTTP